jgi:hypothetical protein
LKKEMLEEKLEEAKGEGRSVETLYRKKETTTHH